MPKGRVIIDELTKKPAGVDTQGRLKTTAEIEVETDLDAFDNVADSWFFVTLAGAIGDTIRVQIAAPDAVDVTTTLTATEAGDKNATAALVVADLNADTEFVKNWVAKVLQGIVFVTSLIEAEDGERIAANSLQVTVTGTTTVTIPISNDVIKRREKQAEGTVNPTDPRNILLSFRGETSSVTKASRPIFISETEESTSASEIRMIVDRSPDNIVATPAVVPEDDDVYLGTFLLNAIGKQVEFIAAKGHTRETQKTFLASEGGAGRDTYRVGDYVIKDHRGAVAPASFTDANGSLLVVERWTGTQWNLLDHGDYDIVDVFQRENDCDILITGPAPPAGGDGIRINYAKMIKLFKVRVGVDGSVPFVPATPIKLNEVGGADDFDIIAVNAAQQSAGVGSATVNISGFPINRKTGEI